jgi:hypothetical protein
LGRVVSGALVAHSLFACASFEGRLLKAEYQTCPQVLADYPMLSRDPSYREQLDHVRHRYESDVAKCYLVERKPEKALALAGTWGEEYRLSSLEVTARAHAQLDKEAEARAALESLARRIEVNPEFFLEPPEFRNYVRRDWFVLLALDVWSRKREEWLETFARKFARVRGEGLLSLPVAAADAQRAPGEWALWLGVVRKGQINRAGGETLLLVEGLDIENGRLTRERVRALRVEDGEVRPEYESQQTQYESFVPNGQLFWVQFPGVNEGLVGMSTVLAFGRYLGRSGEENLPTLRASVVTKRTPKQDVAQP